MEGYGYPYPQPFPPMRTPDGAYPDHGDGFGEYYGVGPLNEDPERRPSRSKNRTRKHKDTKRSHSRSVTETKSRSRSPSRTRSHSSGTRTRSVSRSRSRTRSRSKSETRHREIGAREPSVLDAFRVLYLIPSKHKKNTHKYLATQKRQDRVQELLKSDGLGSKRWFFYPRSQATNDPEGHEVAGSRDNCDQRIKVDAVFFRKYKRSRKINSDAPIAKLKRWELLLYKKLGFIQAA